MWGSTSLAEAFYNRYLLASEPAGGRGPALTLAELLREHPAMSLEPVRSSRKTTVQPRRR